jgi:protein gp37
MGSKTKIDWADSTWNPVTGCLHGCEYCYARGIANRFGLPYAPKLGDPGMEGAKKYDSAEGMDTMLELVKPYEANGRKQPYPMGFLPTFHRYKLEEPQHWKKPRTIFVCSMADLFGAWVPDEWIKAVFDACSAAPQHRYMFLTKNPKRYIEAYGWYYSKIQRISKAFEGWFGYTYDGYGNVETRKALKRQYSFRQFISIEPLLSPLWDDEINSIICTCDWVIVGAETGNRKRKIVPDKAWVMKIADGCDRSGIPVFMKESLRGIMGEDFRHEFPWEV